MTPAAYRRLFFVPSATLALGVLGMTALGAGLGPLSSTTSDTRPVLGASAPLLEATLPSAVTERRREVITDLGF